MIFRNANDCIGGGHAFHSRRVVRFGRAREARACNSQPPPVSTARVRQRDRPGDRFDGRGRTGSCTASPWNPRPERGLDGGRGAGDRDQGGAPAAQHRADGDPGLHRHHPAGAGRQGRVRSHPADPRRFRSAADRRRLPHLLVPRLGRGRTDRRRHDRLLPGRDAVRGAEQPGGPAPQVLRHRSGGSASRPPGNAIRPGLHGRGDHLSHQEP